MTFVTGDPVWITFGRPDLNIVGDLPGIVSRVGMFQGYAGYYVEVPAHRSSAPNGLWFSLPENLRPRKDDPGRQASTWDKCIWKPSEVAA